MDSWEKAVRTLYGTSDGKSTPAQMLATMAPAWTAEGFTLFDHARVAAALAADPPLHAAQVAAAKRTETAAHAGADRVANETRVVRLDEARRFRELAKQNPFEAAELARRAGHPSHLYEPDDGSGPSAA